MSNITRTILDRVTLLLGLALVLATGVVLVAHDGPSGATGPSAKPGAAIATDAVEIKNFLFEPEAVTVAAGTTITFTNRDSAPHTATSGPARELRGVFDSGTLSTGQSSSVTLSEPGTFAYFCELHAFMKATVIVT